MAVTVTGIGQLHAEIDRVLRDTVKDLSQQVFDRARANTPVRSGRARRAWTKTVDDAFFQVENRVAYIERLEAGASKQAPKGIIGPTLAQIKGK